MMNPGLTAVSGGRVSGAPRTGFSPGGKAGGAASRADEADVTPGADGSDARVPAAVAGGPESAEGPGGVAAGFPDWGTALPVGLPAMRREVIFKVLGSAKRWRMLTLLMDGEPHRVKELARAGGCSESLASKHAQVLLKTGLVVERVGLYRLNPVWRAGPGVLDFGHAVLRVDWGRPVG